MKLKRKTVWKTDATNRLFLEKMDKIDKLPSRQTKKKIKTVSGLRGDQKVNKGQLYTHKFDNFKKQIHFI